MAINWAIPLMGASASILCMTDWGHDVSTAADAIQLHRLKMHGYVGDHKCGECSSGSATSSTKDSPHAVSKEASDGSSDMEWTVKGFLHAFPYDTSKEVGSGGFGTVYGAAFDIDYYVVKIISKQGRDEEDLSLAREEMRLHEGLRHANVCALYGWSEDTNNFYLALENCSGGELWKFRDENGRFTEQWARTCLKQILNGVSYIHEQGIVHCDLKLENILLCPTGQAQWPWMAKICDFGLAARCAPGKKTVIHPRGFCGTLDYFAPEIVSNFCAERPNKVDAKVDVYALGVMLELMVSSAGSPFRGQGDDDGKTLRNIHGNRRQCAFPNDVSASCKNLHEQMVSRVAASRLSAEECISFLEIREWLHEDLSVNREEDWYARAEGDLERLILVENRSCLEAASVIIANTKSFDFFILARRYLGESRVRVLMCMLQMSLGKENTAGLGTDPLWTWLEKEHATFHSPEKAASLLWKVSETGRCESLIQDNMTSYIDGVQYQLGQLFREKAQK